MISILKLKYHLKIIIGCLISKVKATANSVLVLCRPIEDNYAVGILLNTIFGLANGRKCSAPKPIHFRWLQALNYSYYDINN